ncbi:hypothetical protein DFS34DRAFT_597212 [Phlyctochytrium arcticum]|nr:hypothetical protein DFS34DRAFT_597212 [Phlyctochytrium arcticum]
MFLEMAKAGAIDLECSPEMESVICSEWTGNIRMLQKAARKSAGGWWSPRAAATTTTTTTMRTATRQKATMRAPILFLEEVASQRAAANPASQAPRQTCPEIVLSDDNDDIPLWVLRERPDTVHSRTQIEIYRKSDFPIVQPGGVTAGPGHRVKQTRGERRRVSYNRESGLTVIDDQSESVNGHPRPLIPERKMGLCEYSHQDRRILPTSPPINSSSNSNTKLTAVHFPRVKNFHRPSYYILEEIELIISHREPDSPHIR